MKKYVISIDQGTTSSRCILFDQTGSIVATAQKEHRQIYPRPGWVEHDALEIWQTVQLVITEVLVKTEIKPDEIAACGITNQRETTVVWERATGRPIANAIVWQDTRTAGFMNQLAAEGGQDRFREIVGLPTNPYFSGSKIRWLLDNVLGAREKAENGELCFGTIDTWLIWNLTGGPQGGKHVTDVSNASRTFLMNLKTLDWDADMLEIMGVPRSVLPEIRSSSEIYGKITAGVSKASRWRRSERPAGALFGQTCFTAGEPKNTYGNRLFPADEHRHEPIQSKNGLLTTLA